MENQAGKIYVKVMRVGGGWVARHVGNGWWWVGAR